ncbi:MULTISPECIES: hypothetical protein [unclassified Streptomyces]|uniref:hypothetical protein n=1 Tax=unclassified Streptomyces TaxID=2593676 RepID=UPI0011AF8778|nr:hypothetical protein [Streptomyces sp. CB02959]
MKRTTTAVLAAAMAIAALSACDADGPNTKTAKSAPATAAPTTESTPSSKDEDASKDGAAPALNAEQTQKLMGALKAVDPALGDNEKWALAASGTICADIRAGQADSDVLQGAKLRFQGTTPGTIKSLSDGQAARIVTAVKSSFCK